MIFNFFTGNYSYSFYIREQIKYFKMTISSSGVDPDTKKTNLPYNLSMTEVEIKTHETLSTKDYQDDPNSEKKLGGYQSFMSAPELWPRNMPRRLSSQFFTNITNIYVNNLSNKNEECERLSNVWEDDDSCIVFKSDKKFKNNEECVSLKNADSQPPKKTNYISFLKQVS